MATSFFVQGYISAILFWSCPNDAEVIAIATCSSTHAVPALWPHCLHGAAIHSVRSEALHQTYPNYAHPYMHALQSSVGKTAINLLFTLEHTSVLMFGNPFRVQLVVWAPTSVPWPTLLCLVIGFSAWNWVELHTRVTLGVPGIRLALSIAAVLPRHS